MKKAPSSTKASDKSTEENDFVVSINNVNFPNDTILNLTIGDYPVPIKYFQVYTSSTFIARHYNFANIEKEMSQKLKDLQETFGIAENNLLAFIQILLGEKVVVNTNNFSDINLLAKEFQTQQLIEQMNQYANERLFQTVDSIVILLLQQLELGQSKRQLDFSNDYLKRLLSQKISECFDSAEFLKLDSKLIDEILENSKKADIPSDKVLDFVVNDLDKQHQFFKYMDIHSLSKEKLGELFELVQSNRDDKTKMAYFNEISVDIYSVLRLAMESIKPVGHITLSLQSPGDDYLPCDGRLIDANEYPALYPELKDERFNFKEWESADVCDGSYKNNGIASNEQFYVFACSKSSSPYELHIFYRNKNGTNWQSKIIESQSSYSYNNFNGFMIGIMYGQGYFVIPFVNSSDYQIYIFYAKNPNDEWIKKQIINTSYSVSPYVYFASFVNDYFVIGGYEYINSSYYHPHIWFAKLPTDNWQKYRFNISTSYLGICSGVAFGKGMWSFIVYNTSQSKIYSFYGNSINSPSNPTEIGSYQSNYYPTYQFGNDTFVFIHHQYIYYSKSASGPFNRISIPSPLQAGHILSLLYTNGIFITVSRDSYGRMFCAFCGNDINQWSIIPIGEFQNIHIIDLKYDEYAKEIYAIGYDSNSRRHFFSTKYAKCLPQLQYGFIKA